MHTRAQYLFVFATCVVDHGSLHFVRGEERAGLKLPNLVMSFVMTIGQSGKISK